MSKETQEVSMQPTEVLDVEERGEGSSRGERRALWGTVGLVVLGVVLAPLLLLGALHAAGASLLPSAPTPRPSAPALAKPVEDTPAQKVLAQVVALPGSRLPGGWKEDALSTTLQGSPLSDACGSGFSGATPEWSSARRYLGTGSGSPAADVRLWAYSAGEGGVGMEGFSSLVRTCSGKGGVRLSSSSVGLGVEGMQVVSTSEGGQSVWVVWRRGDVVAGVSLASGDAGEAVILARVVDQTLEGSLAGACAEESSTAADHTRNPYDKDFAPWGASVLVGGGGLPDLTPSVPSIPAPPSFPSVDNPALLTAPGVPEVSRKPALPTPPAVAPASESVSIPLADVKGPGCGWSFTGMHAPSVSEGAISAEAQKRLLAGQSDLTRREEQALVAEVAYQDALLAWAGQMEAYQEWHAYRGAQAAAVARQRAQAAASASPTPSPSASPTPSPTPTPSPSPSPTPTPTPSPSPSPSPTPAPTPPVVVPTPSPSPSPSPSASPGPSKSGGTP